MIRRLSVTSVDRTVCEVAATPSRIVSEEEERVVIRDNNCLDQVSMHHSVLACAPSRVHCHCHRTVCVCHHAHHHHVHGHAHHLHQHGHSHHTRSRSLSQDQVRSVAHSINASQEVVANTTEEISAPSTHIHVHHFHHPHHHHHLVHGHGQYQSNHSLVRIGQRGGSEHSPARSTHSQTRLANNRLEGGHTDRSMHLYTREYSHNGNNVFGRSQRNIQDTSSNRYERSVYERTEEEIERLKGGKTVVDSHQSSRTTPVPPRVAASVDRHRMSSNRNTAPSLNVDLSKKDLMMSRLMKEWEERKNRERMEEEKRENDREVEEMVERNRKIRIVREEKEREEMETRLRDEHNRRIREEEERIQRQQEIEEEQERLEAIDREREILNKRKQQLIRQREEEEERIKKVEREKIRIIKERERIEEKIREEKDALEREKANNLLAKIKAEEEEIMREREDLERLETERLHLIRQREDIEREEIERERERIHRLRIETEERKIQERIERERREDRERERREEELQKEIERVRQRERELIEEKEREIEREKALLDRTLKEREMKERQRKIEEEEQRRQRAREKEIREVEEARKRRLREELEREAADERERLQRERSIEKARQEEERQKEKRRREKEISRQKEIIKETERIKTIKTKDKDNGLTTDNTEDSRGDRNRNTKQPKDKVRPSNKVESRRNERPAVPSRSTSDDRDRIDREQLFKDLIQREREERANKNKKPSERPALIHPVGPGYGERTRARLASPDDEFGVDEEEEEMDDRQFEKPEEYYEYEHEVYVPAKKSKAKPGKEDKGRVSKDDNVPSNRPTIPAGAQRNPKQNQNQRVTVSPKYQNNMPIEGDWQEFGEDYDNARPQFNDQIDTTRKTTKDESKKGKPDTKNNPQKPRNITVATDQDEFGAEDEEDYTVPKPKRPNNKDLLRQSNEELVDKMLNKDVPSMSASSNPSMKNSDAQIRNNGKPINPKDQSKQGDFSKSKTSQPNQGQNGQVNNKDLESFPGQVRLDGKRPQQPQQDSKRTDNAKSTKDQKSTPQGNYPSPGKNRVDTEVAGINKPGRSPDRSGPSAEAAQKTQENLSRKNTQGGPKPTNQTYDTRKGEDLADRRPNGRGKLAEPVEPSNEGWAGQGDFRRMNTGERPTVPGRSNQGPQVDGDNEDYDRLGRPRANQPGRETPTPLYDSKGRPVDEFGKPLPGRKTERDELEDDKREFDEFGRPLDSFKIPPKGAVREKKKVEVDQYGKPITQGRTPSAPIIDSKGRVVDEYGRPIPEGNRPGIPTVDSKGRIIDEYGGLVPEGGSPTRPQFDSRGRFLDESGRPLSYSPSSRRPQYDSKGRLVNEDNKPIHEVGKPGSPGVDGRGRPVYENGRANPEGGRPGAPAVDSRGRPVDEFGRPLPEGTRPGVQQYDSKGRLVDQYGRPLPEGTRPGAQAVDSRGRPVDEFGRVISEGSRPGSPSVDSKGRQIDEFGRPIPEGSKPRTPAVDSRGRQVDEFGRPLPEGVRPGAPAVDSRGRQVDEFGRPLPGGESKPGVQQFDSKGRLVDQYGRPIPERNKPGVPAVDSRGRPVDEFGRPLPEGERPGVPGVDSRGRPIDEFGRPIPEGSRPGAPRVDSKGRLVDQYGRPIPEGTRPGAPAVDDRGGPLDEHGQSIPEGTEPGAPRTESRGRQVDEFRRPIPEGTRPGVQQYDTKGRLVDQFGRPVPEGTRPGAPAVDDRGRPIDEFGRPLPEGERPGVPGVDSRGRPIDEFGRPLPEGGNKPGVPASDTKGRSVDKSGRPISQGNKQGSPAVDNKGSLVDQFGRPLPEGTRPGVPAVDSRGRPVDEFGRPLPEGTRPGAPAVDSRGRQVDEFGRPLPEGVRPGAPAVDSRGRPVDEFGRPLAGKRTEREELEDDEKEFDEYGRPMESVKIAPKGAVREKKQVVVDQYGRPISTTSPSSRNPANNDRSEFKDKEDIKSQKPTSKHADERTNNSDKRSPTGPSKRSPNQVGRNLDEYNKVDSEVNPGNRAPSAESNNKDRQFSYGRPAYPTKPGPSDSNTDKTKLTRGDTKNQTAKKGLNPSEAERQKPKTTSNIVTDGRTDKGSNSFVPGRNGPENQDLKRSYENDEENSQDDDFGDDLRDLVDENGRIIPGKLSPTRSEVDQDKNNKLNDFGGPKQGLNQGGRNELSDKYERKQTSPKDKKKTERDELREEEQEVDEYGRPLDSVNIPPKGAVREKNKVVVDQYGRQVPSESPKRRAKYDEEGKLVDEFGHPVPEGTRPGVPAVDSRGRPIDEFGRPLPEKSKPRTPAVDDRGRPVDEYGRPIPEGNKPGAPAVDSRGRQVDEFGRPLPEGTRPGEQQFDSKGRLVEQYGRPLPEGTKPGAPAVDSRGRPVDESGRPLPEGTRPVAPVLDSRGRPLDEFGRPLPEGTKPRTPGVDNRGRRSDEFERPVSEGSEPELLQYNEEGRLVDEFGRPVPESMRPGAPGVDSRGRPVDEFGRPLPEGARPGSTGVDSRDRSVDEYGRPIPEGTRPGAPAVDDRGRPVDEFGRPIPEGSKPAVQQYDSKGRLVDQYGRPVPESTRPGVPAVDSRGRPVDEFGRPIPEGSKPRTPAVDSRGRQVDEFGRPIPEGESRPGEQQYDSKGRLVDQYGRPVPEGVRPGAPAVDDRGRPVDESGRPLPEGSKPRTPAVDSRGRPVDEFGRLLSEGSRPGSPSVDSKRRPVDEFGRPLPEGSKLGVPAQDSRGRPVDEFGRPIPEGSKPRTPAVDSRGRQVDEYGRPLPEGTRPGAPAVDSRGRPVDQYRKPIPEGESRPGEQQYDSKGRLVDQYGRPIPEGTRPGVPAVDSRGRPLDEFGRPLPEGTRPGAPVLDSRGRPVDQYGRPLPEGTRPGVQQYDSKGRLVDQYGLPVSEGSRPGSPSKDSKGRPIDEFGRPLPEGARPGAPAVDIRGKPVDEFGRLVPEGTRPGVQQYDSKGRLVDQYGRPVPEGTRPGVPAVDSRGRPVDEYGRPLPEGERPGTPQVDSRGREVDQYSRPIPEGSRPGVPEVDDRGRPIDEFGRPLPEGNKPRTPGVDNRGRPVDEFGRPLAGKRTEREELEDDEKEFDEYGRPMESVKIAPKGAVREKKQVVVDQYGRQVAKDQTPKNTPYNNQVVNEDEEGSNPVPPGVKSQTKNTREDNQMNKSLKAKPGQPVDNVKQQYDEYGTEDQPGGYKSPTGKVSPTNKGNKKDEAGQNKNKEPVKQTPKANDRLENFEKTGTFGRKETTPKQLGPTVEEFEAENDLGYVPNEGEDWPNSNTQKKQTPLGRGKEQEDRGKLARQETNKDKPTPKNRQQVRDEDVEEQEEEIDNPSAVPGPKGARSELNKRRDEMKETTANQNRSPTSINDNRRRPDKEEANFNQPTSKPVSPVGKQQRQDTVGSTTSKPSQPGKIPSPDQKSRGKQQEGKSYPEDDQDREDSPEGWPGTNDFEDLDDDLLAFVSKPKGPSTLPGKKTADQAKTPKDRTGKTRQEDIEEELERIDNPQTGKPKNVSPDALGTEAQKEKISKTYPANVPGRQISPDKLPKQGTEAKTTNPAFPTTKSISPEKQARDIKTEISQPNKKTTPERADRKDQQGGKSEQPKVNPGTKGPLAGKAEQGFGRATTQKSIASKPNSPDQLLAKDEIFSSMKSPSTGPSGRPGAKDQKGKKEELSSKLKDSDVSPLPSPTMAGKREDLLGKNKLSQPQIGIKPDLQSRKVKEEEASKPGRPGQKHTILNKQKDAAELNKIPSRLTNSEIDDRQPEDEDADKKSQDWALGKSSGPIGAQKNDQTSKKGESLKSSVGPQKLTPAEQRKIDEAKKRGDSVAKVGSKTSPIIEQKNKKDEIAKGAKPGEVGPGAKNPSFDNRRKTDENASKRTPSKSPTIATKPEELLNRDSQGSLKPVSTSGRGVSPAQKKARNESVKRQTPKGGPDSKVNILSMKDRQITKDQVGKTAPENKGKPASPEDKQKDNKPGQTAGRQGVPSPKITPPGQALSDQQVGKQKGTSVPPEKNTKQPQAQVPSDMGDEEDAFRDTFAAEGGMPDFADIYEDHSENPNEVRKKPVIDGQLIYRNNDSEFGSEADDNGSLVPGVRFAPGFDIKIPGKQDKDNKGQGQGAATLPKSKTTPHLALSETKNSGVDLQGPKSPAFPGEPSSEEEGLEEGKKGKGWDLLNKRQPEDATKTPDKSAPARKPTGQDKKPQQPEGDKKGGNRDIFGSRETEDDRFGRGPSYDDEMDEYGQKSKPGDTGRRKATVQNKVNEHEKLKKLPLKKSDEDEFADLRDELGFDGARFEQGDEEEEGEGWPKRINPNEGVVPSANAKPASAIKEGGSRGQTPTDRQRGKVPQPNQPGKEKIGKDDEQPIRSKPTTPQNAVSKTDNFKNPSQVNDRERRPEAPETEDKTAKPKSPLDKNKITAPGDTSKSRKGENAKNPEQLFRPQPDEDEEEEDLGNWGNKPNPADKKGPDSSMRNKDQYNDEDNLPGWGIKDSSDLRDFIEEFDKEKKGPKPAIPTAPFNEDALKSNSPASRVKTPSQPGQTIPATSPSKLTGIMGKDKDSRPSRHQTGTEQPIPPTQAEREDRDLKKALAGLTGLLESPREELGDTWGDKKPTQKQSPESRGKGQQKPNDTKPNQPTNDNIFNPKSYPGDYDEEEEENAGRDTVPKNNPWQRRPGQEDEDNDEDSNLPLKQSAGFNIPSNAVTQPKSRLIGPEGDDEEYETSKKPSDSVGKTSSPIVPPRGAQDERIKRPKEDEEEGDRFIPSPDFKPRDTKKDTGSLSPSKNPERSPIDKNKPASPMKGDRDLTNRDRPKDNRPAPPIEDEDIENPSVVPAADQRQPGKDNTQRETPKGRPQPPSGTGIFARPTDLRFDSQIDSKSPDSLRQTLSPKDQNKKGSESIIKSLAPVKPVISESTGSIGEKIDAIGSLVRNRPDEDYRDARNPSPEAGTDKQGAKRPQSTTPTQDNRSPKPKPEEEQGFNKNPKSKVPDAGRQEEESSSDLPHKGWGDKGRKEKVEQPESEGEEEENDLRKFLTQDKNKKPNVPDRPSQTDEDEDDEYAPDRNSKGWLNKDNQKKKPDNELSDEDKYNRPSNKKETIVKKGDKTKQPKDENEDETANPFERKKTDKERASRDQNKPRYPGENEDEDEEVPTRNKEEKTTVSKTVKPGTKPSEADEEEIEKKKKGEKDNTKSPKQNIPQKRKPEDEDEEEQTTTTVDAYGRTIVKPQRKPTKQDKEEDEDELLKKKKPTDRLNKQEDVIVKRPGRAPEEEDEDQGVTTTTKSPKPSQPGKEKPFGKTQQEEEEEGEEEDQQGIKKSPGRPSPRQQQKKTAEVLESEDKSKSPSGVSPNARPSFRNQERGKPVDKLENVEVLVPGMGKKQKESIDKGKEKILKPGQRKPDDEEEEEEEYEGDQPKIKPTTPGSQKKTTDIKKNTPEEELPWEQPEDIPTKEQKTKISSKTPTPTNKIIPSMPLEEEDLLNDDMGLEDFLAGKIRKDTKPSTSNPIEPRLGSSTGDKYQKQMNKPTSPMNNPVPINPEEEVGLEDYLNIKPYFNNPSKQRPDIEYRDDNEDIRPKEVLQSFGPLPELPAYASKNLEGFDQKNTKSPKTSQQTKDKQSTDVIGTLPLTKPETQTSIAEFGYPDFKDGTFRHSENVDRTSQPSWKKELPIRTEPDQSWRMEPESRDQSQPTPKERENSSSNYPSSSQSPIGKTKEGTRKASRNELTPGKQLPPDSSPIIAADYKSPDFGTTPTVKKQDQKELTGLEKYIKPQSPANAEKPKIPPQPKESSDEKEGDDEDFDLRNSIENVPVPPLQPPKIIPPEDQYNPEATSDVDREKIKLSQDEDELKQPFEANSDEDDLRALLPSQPTPGKKIPEEAAAASKIVDLDRPGGARRADVVQKVNTTAKDKIITPGKKTEEILGQNERNPRFRYEEDEDVEHEKPAQGSEKIKEGRTITSPTKPSNDVFKDIIGAKKPSSEIQAGPTPSKLPSTNNVRPPGGSSDVAGKLNKEGDKTKPQREVPEGVVPPSSAAQFQRAKNPETPSFPEEMIPPSSAAQFQREKKPRQEPEETVPPSSAAQFQREKKPRPEVEEIVPPKSGAQFQKDKKPQQEPEDIVPPLSAAQFQRAKKPQDNPEELAPVPSPGAQYNKGKNPRQPEENSTVQGLAADFVRERQPKNAESPVPSSKTADIQRSKRPYEDETEPGQPPSSAAAYQKGKKPLEETEPAQPPSSAAAFQRGNKPDKVSPLQSPMSTVNKMKKPETELPNVPVIPSNPAQKGKKGDIRESTQPEGKVSPASKDRTPREDNTEMSTSPTQRTNKPGPEPTRQSEATKEKIPKRPQDHKFLAEDNSSVLNMPISSRDGPRHLPEDRMTDSDVQVRPPSIRITPPSNSNSPTDRSRGGKEAGKKEDLTEKPSGIDEGRTSSKTPPLKPIIPKSPVEELNEPDLESREDRSDDQPVVPPGRKPKITTDEIKELRQAAGVIPRIPPAQGERIKTKPVESPEHSGKEEDEENDLRNYLASAEKPKQPKEADLLEHDEADQDLRPPIGPSQDHSWDHGSEGEGIPSQPLSGRVQPPAGLRKNPQGGRIEIYHDDENLSPDLPNRDSVESDHDFIHLNNPMSEQNSAIKQIRIDTGRLFLPEPKERTEPESGEAHEEHDYINNNLSQGDNSHHPEDDVRSNKPINKMEDLEGNQIVKTERAFQGDEDEHPDRADVGDFLHDDFHQSPDQDDLLADFPNPYKDMEKEIERELEMHGYPMKVEDAHPPSGGTVEKSLAERAKEARQRRQAVAQQRQNKKIDEKIVKPGEKNLKVVITPEFTEKSSRKASEKVLNAPRPGFASDNRQKVVSKNFTESNIHKEPSETSDNKVITERQLGGTEPPLNKPIKPFQTQSLITREEFDKAEPGKGRRKAEVKQRQNEGRKSLPQGSDIHAIAAAEMMKEFHDFEEGEDGGHEFHEEVHVEERKPIASSVITAPKVQKEIARRINPIRTSDKDDEESPHHDSEDEIDLRDELPLTKPKTRPPATRRKSGDNTFDVPLKSPSSTGPGQDDDVVSTDTQGRKKPKIGLTEMMKKPFERGPLPELYRQGQPNNAAIPDPKPADIDNRDFYLEKTKLGGYTISKKPRFTEKEPLDIEMIRHIKKFPAMPDQVNPNNKD